MSLSSLELTFNTVFDTKYQRNNKTTGRKNIRCYPGCTPTGHVKNGFCGQRVSLSVGTPLSLEQLQGSYVVVGEIVLSNGENSTMPEVLDASGMLSHETMVKMTRSVRSPCEPLIPGRFQMEGDQIVLSFNEEQMGWHYSWIGTKDTANAAHCFKVHVFRLCDESVVEYVRSIQSSDFLIFSRRRMARLKTSASSSKKDTVQQQQQQGSKGVNSKIKQTWNAWFKGKTEAGALLPKSLSGYEDDDVKMPLNHSPTSHDGSMASTVISGNSGEDNSYCGISPAISPRYSNRSDSRRAEIEDKVQALFAFIFNGEHQKWLPDGGINPNAKYTPVDMKKATMKRPSPSQEDNYEWSDDGHENEFHLDQFSQTVPGLLDVVDEQSNFRFNPATMGKQPKQPRVASNEFDMSNIDFAQMMTLMAGPSEESSSDMNQYSTLLLPDEVDMVQSDYPRAVEAFNQVDDRTKNHILNFVHHIFDEPDLHDKITEYFRMRCKHPAAAKLLKEWSSNPERREVLQSITGSDLKYSESSWTENSSRGFLLQSLQGLRVLMTNHVEEYFERAGCSLDSIELGLQPRESKQIAIVSQPHANLDADKPLPPSYISRIGLVDIVVRRVNAELTPSLSQLLNDDDDDIVVAPPKLGNEKEMLESALPRRLPSTTGIAFDGKWTCVEDLSDFKESPLAQFAGNTQMPHSSLMLQKVMPRLFTEVVLQYIPNRAFLVEGRRFLLAYPKRQFPLDGIARPFQWSTPVVLEDFCIHFYQAWASPNPEHGYPDIVNKLMFLRDSHDTSTNLYKYRLLRQYRIQPPGVLQNVVKIFAFADAPPSNLSEFLDENHPNIISKFCREYHKL